jgi:hypothetical protein
MKHLFLLFSLFLLLSCSSSDDSNGSSGRDFNPPTWIQGTWIQENELGLPGVKFSFSNHDFCMTNSGISAQCQQAFVDQFRQQTNDVSVIENITATTYTAEIKYFAGQSIIYSFKKLNNNSMEWTAVPGAVFTKQ